jgi:predicted phosphoribosyltransferase
MGDCISDDIIVLGIPRGGVVTADVISKKLNASFNILIPRKIAGIGNRCGNGRWHYISK